MPLDPSQILERARQIKLVCTDIDGVLTSGSLFYGSEPGHTKIFHVRDGVAVKLLQRSGIRVAFISGLHSPASLHRAQDLGIEDCYLGRLEKLPILEELKGKLGLQDAEIAHVGDDLHDLPLLDRVGLACCPSDAVQEVRDRVHWIIPALGGSGVLRILAQDILKAQGKWLGALEPFIKR